jgi:hypothetical protein
MPQAADPKTAGEIRVFVREYEEGFNRHDATALGAFARKTWFRYHQKDQYAVGKP